MITRSFPAAERGLALGVNMILVAVSISLGPVVGGILTQFLGWRWIFYVNLPVGAVLLFAAWRVLTQRQQVRRQRFDVAAPRS